MEQIIKNIKKQIIYRCSYTGTKETDLLYKRIFLEKLDNFTHSELNQISDLLMDISDLEIFSILTCNKIPPIRFKKLFNKLMND